VDTTLLLEQLGRLHAPGDVHLVWREETVTVADHHFTPIYGMVVEHEVWPEGHEGMSERLHALDDASRRARQSEEPG
jgi:hypothetical protein